MNKLSEHTLLINLFIALTKKDKKFPSYFREIGFDIEWIEPKWTSGTLTFNPDIFLMDSVKSHLLITECKSGGLDQIQAERYTQINKDDIVHSNMVRTSLTDYDFSFACYDINLNKIKTYLTSKGVSFPIFVKGDNKLMVVDNNFKHENLKRKFSGELDLPKEIPTSYFPFNTDDDDDYIITILSQSLMRFMGLQKEFTIEGLIKDSNHFFDSTFMQKEAMSSLKGRVGKMLTYLSNRTDSPLFDFIKKVSGTDNWRFTNRNVTKFSEAINRYLSSPHVPPSEALSGTQAHI